MKKIIVFSLFMALAAPAFAVQRGTPEYDQMKAIKQKQREEKKLKKTSESAPNTKTEKGFWQREAERSGFAGTGAMFNKAISAAIPLDKLNSKKES